MAARLTVSEFRLRRRRGLDLWWHTLRALIWHYRFLRGRGCGRREAWWLAGQFSRAAALGVEGDGH